MADWNKKPEFQDEKTEETEKMLDKYTNKIIIDTVDYTESRCKRKFRTWLAELLMLASGISLTIYMINAFIERMKVLPTEPYRDKTVLEYIFIFTAIMSIVFAQIVMYRNE